MENWTLDDWLNDLDNCVKRGLYFEISGHSAGLLRDQIKKGADEIERLRRENKVQACTIRSLQYSKSQNVLEAHIAIKTLDSEREANKILTDEIERLREQAHYHYENGLKKDVDIESLRDALRWAAPYTKDDPRVSAIIKAALKEGE
jgi:hypothetical protein